VRKLTYLSALVLMFALPWEDSVSIPGIGSLARLMGFAAAGLWIGTILIEGKFRKPTLFHGLVLLFFLWSFVSLFWSYDVENTLKRIKTYSQIFLLVLICWEVFQRREQMRAGLQAYIFGAYVLIGSVVYNYVAGNVAVQYEGRYSASGVNANDVALVLIIALPISMYLFFIRDRSFKGTVLRGINLLCIPLSIFAIVLTGSRTSLIAVVPFAFFMVVSQRIKVKQKLLIFAILLVSLLALYPFVPPVVITRIGTIGNSIGQMDLGGRVTMWRRSIVVLNQHPILGVGSGAVDSQIGGAVHNTLISVVSETGFIGLALFLSILGLVIFDVIRLDGRTSGLLLVVFATWAIGAFSLSWEFRKITWIILSFLIIESGFGKQLDEAKENMNFSGGVERSSVSGESIGRPKVVGWK
jgi:O-antigen ligase